MSIADHFDHTPDASFVRTFDAGAARRQFQISLVLVVVLASAAFVLGMMIRFDDGPSSTPVVQQPTMQQPVVAPASMKTTPKARSVDTDFAGSLSRFQG